MAAANDTDEVNGGLAQLVLVGAEDNFLSTEEATDTIFKDERSRVAKYAHVWTEVTRPTEYPDLFHQGGTYLKFSIAREGDLLNCIQFEAQLESDYLPYLLPGVPGCCADTAHQRNMFFDALSVLFMQRELFGENRTVLAQARKIELDEAVLVIGNNRISTLYGEYERFKGNTPEVLLHEGLYDPRTQTTSKPGCLLRIRMDFGLSGPRALPMVALAYHDVSVLVRLKARAPPSQGQGSPPGPQGAPPQPRPDPRRALSFVRRTRLHVSYLLLDAAERRRFATNRHDSVITRTTHLSSTQLIHAPPDWVSFRLALYHPTISLAFRVRDSGGRSVPLEYVRLRINNYVRIQAHGFELLCHSYQDEPRSRGPFREFGPDALYVIKFAIPNAATARQLLPHGTLNFTRVDETRIEVKPRRAASGDAGEYSLECYQDCTNLLRIRGGMAATAYPQ